MILLKRRAVFKTTRLESQAKQLPCRAAARHRISNGAFHVIPLSVSYQPTCSSSRISVVAHSLADVQPENAQQLISALAKASNAWDKYDKDRSGRMSPEECEELFNSPEINEAFLLVTNIPPRRLSAKDLEPYFKRADKDSSGCLTRTEFLALYSAILSERIQRNPLLLAEVLLGLLDKDKNGVLEGNELKPVLAILGFAPALLLPIPGFVQVPYRDILAALRGEARSK